VIKSTDSIHRADPGAREAEADRTGRESAAIFSARRYAAEHQELTSGQEEHLVLAFLAGASWCASHPQPKTAPAKKRALDWSKVTPAAYQRLAEQRAREILDELKREWPHERFWQHDIGCDIVELVSSALSAAAASARAQAVAILRDPDSVYWFWDKEKAEFRDLGKGHIGPTLMAAPLWANVLEHKLQCAPCARRVKPGGKSG
jgi:hypothetical protein